MRSCEIAVKFKQALFVATAAFSMIGSAAPPAAADNSCANASQRDDHWTENQCKEAQAHAKHYCDMPHACSQSGLDERELTRRTSNALNCKGAYEDVAKSFKVADSSQRKAISDATALFNECRRKQEEARDARK
jgi:hypothetical protein